MSENRTADQFMQTLALIFETDPGKLSRETTFDDDLDATSMSLFMVANHMKELTGVEVTYRQLKGCRTVGDGIDLLEVLQQQRGETAGE